MAAGTSQTRRAHDAWSPQAEAALLASQYERLPILLAINKLVGLVTVVVVAQAVDLLLLVIWLLVLTAILALRLWTWRRFRRAPATPEHIAKWSTRLTLGAGLTGACWGFVGAVLYDPGSVVTGVFIPFVLGGMVSGSITGLSGHMPAFLAYGGSALGPFAVRLVSEADLTHAAMAMLVVLYMAGLWYLARSLGASVRTAVRLGIERSELVTRLQERSAQLEVTIDGIKQGVAVFEPNGDLLAWNQRHAELHEYPDGLYRIGTPLSDFLRFDLARLARGAVSDRLQRWLDEPPLETLQAVRFEKSGRGDRVLEGEYLPMPGGGFVSTAIDITARKLDEARILSLAQHDPLTRLPNRLLFDERLVAASERVRQEGRSMGVLVADIDDFKRINDTFGHPAGDHVLRAVAARLREGLRETDTVARIGGDEFAIVLPGLRDGAALAAIGAALAERLAPPIDIAGQELQVQVSMGAALSPSEGAEPEIVLKNADFAMYQAKAEGTGLRLHGTPVAPEVEARILLERDLGPAIESGQLGLVFQPQVALPQGTVIGVEALLRFDHPNLGVVPPEDVVAAAERSGRTGSLGAFVLREACRAMAATPGSARVAVNLSAAAFEEPDLPARITRVLAETGLPAARLELEVTETSDFVCDEHVAEVFQALRALGVKIALDDFGTGHASFARLQGLPFDVLKIDGSIVRDLSSSVGRGMVEATVVLGRRLGCSVLAEGVETEAEARQLLELGCTAIQGHVVGRPVAARELSQLLATQARGLRWLQAPSGSALGAPTREPEGRWSIRARGHRD